MKMTIDEYVNFSGRFDRRRASLNARLFM